MWFHRLTGFHEEHPDQVRTNLEIAGDSIISRANGRRMVCGRLEIPSLRELRDRLGAEQHPGAPLRLRQVVANVQELHTDPDNAGTIFQVASQFNLLEMVSPSVKPEAGIDRYENDRTQGPACAIACGAGTIFRNYFAEVDGQIGQSEDRQIDCLQELGDALGNDDGWLWEMRNGYVLANKDGLGTIDHRLKSIDENERNQLRGSLRIGVQRNTEVTLGDAGHSVTQVYCSALPVAYSSLGAEPWDGFAQLVLEAAYEATFAVAALQTARGGSNQLFLTLLGGGAFGNREGWILEAIRRALGLFRDSGLKVSIVSYGAPNPLVGHLVDEWASR